MRPSPCADFPRDGTGKARCEPERVSQCKSLSSTVG